MKKEIVVRLSTKADPSGVVKFSGCMEGLGEIAGKVGAAFGGATTYLGQFVKNLASGGIWQADAVDYAVWGADWKAGEFAPPRAEKEKAGEAEERLASPAVGVYLNAVSHRLPLSLDDARRMTASEILEAVNRAKVRDRAFDFEGAYNEAFAEYVRAREEVRARSSAEAGGRR